MSDPLVRETSTDTYVERLRNIVNVAEGYLLDPHRDRRDRIALALLALEKAWICERCEGEGEVDDCDDCPEYKCEVAWTPPLPVRALEGPGVEPGEKQSILDIREGPADA